MTGQSYKASGRFSVLGMMVFLLAGLLGGILLSAGYTYVLGCVSNLFIRLVVMAVFVVAISGWLVWLVRRTKIRNARVVAVLTIVILLLSYYANWAVYVNFVYDTWQKGANEVWAYHFQFPQLIQRWWHAVIHPQQMFEAILQILTSGFLIINGNERLRGVLLLCVWVAEFFIVFALPLYQVIYRAGRPYHEERAMWLASKDEWVVGYFDNYREIRTALRNRDMQPLMEALEQTQYYQLQGQESYAIVEFYRNRTCIGPYITITNVKAVQAGPRKLVHRTVSVVKMMDIGWELAQELYERIEAGYEEQEKKEKKLNWKDQFSKLLFDATRHVKNGASEVRSNAAVKTRKKKAITRRAVQKEAGNSEERPADLEEITVHVPRITREMEKEYLERQKRG